jgi:hypothetical protein
MYKANREYYPFPCGFPFPPPVLPWLSMVYRLPSYYI